jgi:hypothetical protein
MFTVVGDVVLARTNQKRQSTAVATRRTSMKRLIAATAIGLCGLAVATPAASADNGMHHLYIKTPGAWSVFISTRIPGGPQAGPFSACRQLNGSTDFQDGRQDLYDNEKVTLNLFSSRDCTNGAMGTGKTFTVPGNDGLSNFWVDMSR